MELRGTTAIVTGASRGIGVHIARALANKGVDLALAARSAKELEEVASQVRARGVRAIAVPTDVTSLDDLRTLVERTESELGPIDLLVNNAGLECAGYFEEIELEHIGATVEVNLLAVMRLARLVVPGMIERKKGHVCNIASLAGRGVRPFGCVYAGTKHGVVGFSWGLRSEMERHDVEVSVVCPGYVTGEGMFAERETYAGPPPRPFTVSTPEEVAAKTVDAIERNRAQVLVASVGEKLGSLIHVAAPRAGIRMHHLVGSYSYLRKEATGD